LTGSTERLTAALEGRYRVLRRLGEGGMALVYLAEDLKHGRQVALKLLRPELAAALGPERFLREIQIAARLTHPNILPLLDSGDADGTLYYVMPYVEGETLRERLTRERQLPVDEAVRIAQRVATALGYAHGQGVVHRDIKPENILLTGGEPVVADFGIAKAVSAAGQTRLTESGFAVGTAPYMSPEQAGAEAQVDGRSDIYALGCVLYEMLAGAPPFSGPTLHAITARKLTEPVPPLRTVRDTVPIALEQIVFKALARLPADRWATAQQLAEALEAARTSATTPVGPVQAYPPAPLPRARGRWRATLPWTLVLLLTVGLGAMLLARVSHGRASDAVITRFTIHPPPGDSIDFRSIEFRVDWGFRDLDVSPDGRRVVFVGVHANDTTSRLYLRELDAEATSPIAGTEGAYAPFFSSDGEWVAYFNGNDGKLMKVAARGGQPQTICECGPSSGADWGADGWIVMDPGPSRQLTGLRRVKDTGGRPEEVPLTDSTFSAQLWGIASPQILPDGKTVLATLWGGGSSRIVAISLLTGRRTDIQDNAFMGRFVEPGYLLYAMPNELWAVRFDPRRLRTSGQPMRVVDSVLAQYGTWAEYAVSRSGTLVYHAPVKRDGGVRLVWVDRQDRIEPVAGVPTGGWMGARLSPDGSRMVFWGEPHGSSGNGRTWTFDRVAGLRPLTDDAWTSAWPIFAPDGAHIVSNGNPQGGGRFPLFLKSLDAARKPEQLTTTTLMQQPSSWLPGGETLAFQQGIDPKTKWDLYLVSVSGSHTVKPLMVTKWNEREPAFSRDGRWLAYVSDESGRDEVYVRPYPALDAQVGISKGGGDGPVWSADGREIFFATRAGVFAVPFRDGQPGTPRQLVDITQRGSRNALAAPLPFGRNFDVSPDGRFLMLQLQASVSNGGEYHVVLNWFAELESRLRGAR
jgi:serine/threonine-protein kinase